MVSTDIRPDLMAPHAHTLTHRASIDDHFTEQDLRKLTVGGRPAFISAGAGYFINAVSIFWQTRGYLFPTEELAFNDLKYLLSVQHQNSICIHDLFTNEAAAALKDKTADAFKNLALIVSDVYAELWDDLVGYSAA